MILRFRSIHAQSILLAAMLLGVITGSIVLAQRPAGSEAARVTLRLLFLGDNGHHQPAARFRQIQPILQSRGIELTYSEDANDLNPKTLANYDGLLIYANTTEMNPAQEQALLDFVASGKGFLPIHCASYCFLNSPRYIELVGAQFLRHGTGTFRTTIAELEHPILKGFGGFESWDETYVHTKHNERDRLVLEYRAEGDQREPWTWVRTHGKGRVFYTAWGHDDRTWGNPGFQNLLERGIRWAVGKDPQVVPAFADRPTLTPKRQDVKPFQYVEADVPFYPPGERWGTITGGKRQMQLPIDAEESLKHMVTPDGFEVQLFASEPMIGGKPLCMTWDERGRLFVAESYDYPNELKPPGEGRDRIRILEDTDGDGRADHSIVFAEKLSIPTALTAYRGGIICQNGTETIYLKDHDGDDVADERRTLVSGWALGDTHGGVSNFHYGLDNWIWAMQGYNLSDPIIGGQRQPSFRQGFFRFNLTGGDRSPDSKGGVAVSTIEFLRSTNNNTWGLGISEEGIIFGSTANGNPSEYMPIPNRYYEAVRGWSSTVLSGIAESNKFEAITDKVRQVDYHGGFTAGAGHALYTARTYPREYWNRTAFVTEPTGHLIATFVLQPQGAGFRSKNSWNLLASDDEWTGPIMAEVGPDGNMWFIDWYNYIVQHNPTPAGFKTGKGNAYETPLRDKKHGRVYRIAYRKAGASVPMTLRDAAPSTLVATLKHPNMFWRLQAQRLIVERGRPDVVPALIKLASDGGVDETGLNASVVHALWTLRGLGVLDGSNTQATAVAVAALRHTSAGVRRNAVQVLPRDEAMLKVMLESGIIRDPSPQVQLMALLALSEMPASERAGGVLAELFSDQAVTQDRWLADALTSAAARHDRFFLASLAASQANMPATQPANQPRRRSPLNRPPLQAADRVAIVSEHFARGTPDDSLRALLALLTEAPPGVAEAILAGFARGWPKDQTIRLDQKSEKAIEELFSKLPPAPRSQLVLLATRWGSKRLESRAAQIAASFLEQARDQKQGDQTRIQAAEQLIEFRKTDGETASELLKIVSPRTSPELAKGIVDAVSRSEAPSVAAALIEGLGSATPAVRQAAVRAMLGRTEWSRTLLDALDKGTIQLTELSLDQKQGLASHPNIAVANRAKELLARGGSLPNPDRQKVLDEMLRLVTSTGNVEAGREVFKKQCSKCHVHSGEGTKVGPELTGMAVHPKEQLLTEIIDPNRSVEGNFRVYVVALRDGRVLSGLLASESRTAIELFDTEGKRYSVQREDIEEMLGSTRSLMPEGFEKQVSPEEIMDLLEFLTNRGKYLPLDLRKVATTVSTRGMFFNEEADVERLIFPDWTAKTFEGVPFMLVDPQGDRVPNVVMLNGPQGRFPPHMPKSVSVPANAPAAAIHLLSGVSGWGFPFSEKGSVSMIVRLHYADGSTEDHPLLNGVHFADYVRAVDVPESKLAFRLRGQQIRYLSIRPKRTDTIGEIEFVKGADATAPVIMAATLETL